MSETEVPATQSSPESKGDARYVVDLAIWQTEDTVPDGGHQVCELLYTRVLDPVTAIVLLQLLHDGVEGLPMKHIPSDEMATELAAFVLTLRRRIFDVAAIITPEVYQEVMEKSDAPDTPTQDS